MLSKQGFDLWAGQYDETVQQSEENNQYPFAGYKEILNAIYNEIRERENAEVLDIGFGTGILASRLYENGHRIDGIDFSSEMIAIAKAKMPFANLLEWDITKGLPNELAGRKYDAIVSTYALHHLSDEQKVDFLKSLLPLLSAEGKIYIGDIAFQTRADLEKCRKDSEGYWDESEHYFVYEEIKNSLENLFQCEFYPLSHCGGVIVLDPEAIR
ncbi:class I SAM-dependent methyltransferase [Planococcus ruber]|uniref:class I SAM-dependent methyltransferase n=1 Tax=Planococcus ruber TaxID=2027871 RepID=UPI001FEDA867|nr:class I SAM-dependent methyltransferase [Planococcus ruber]MCJ1907596.1 class I SAM-dependent methyltransferase [Planococcus ruber]